MVSLRLFRDPKTLSGLGLSLKGVGFRAPNIQTDKPVYPGSCGEWITLRCSQDEVWMCVEGLRVCCFSQLGTPYPSGVPILRCSVGAWQVPSVPSSSCSWTLARAKCADMSPADYIFSLFQALGLGCNIGLVNPALIWVRDRKHKEPLQSCFRS